METKIEVSEKVLLETINCEKNFSCIKGNGHKLCNVTECINKQVHFLECSDNSICNYKLSYAESYICMCPTRKEIFNKYKI